MLLVLVTRVRRGVVGLVALAACGGGEGEWVVETWGEEYIEQEIPADVFADGCSVTYDEFVVLTRARELRDGNGDVVGEVGGPEAWDVHLPGPTPMGSAPVPADHYSDVVVVVAPDPAAAAGSASDAQVQALATAGASVLAAGTLTCGGASRTFRWTFAETTTYACVPDDLTIPSGGEDTSQLTIHGDHLFYDGLEDPDAAVRGQAVFDADADADGVITLTELEAVSIPTLGYTVGEYSEVVTLRQFVSHLSRTVVHIDGEGECVVDF